MSQQNNTKTTMIGEECSKIWEEKKLWWDAYRSAGKDEARRVLFKLDEQDITMDEFDACESYWQGAVLPHMKENVDLCSYLRAEHKKRREEAHNALQGIETEMQELRNKGVPFSERKYVLNRRSALEKIANDTRRVRTDIENVITYQDVQDIKSDGAWKFASIHLIRFLI